MTRARRTHSLGILLHHLLLLLLQAVPPASCSSSSSSDGNGTLQESTCNQRDCLRCDLETAECVKCLYVIVASSRQCLPACPPSHSTSLPPHTSLMGRVCTERGLLSLVSGRDVSIIAGAAVGGAVCVGVVIGALLYMRRRTKPPPDRPPPDPMHRHPLPRLWRDKRPNTTEKPVADEERAEFLEQLACLRGETTNFLEMLSHTRTRFRTIGGPDSPTDTKAKAYRAVVRDLSRVLTLLNRREEHIVTVPGDWRRLLSWAARVLARYKRQKALKESGEVPTLDPLYSGGSIYQTRRQIQAQRCRLVTANAPCLYPHMPTPPLTHDHTEGEIDSHPSQMGSRSTSLLSLTPIILEECEAEAIFEEDDVESSGSNERDVEYSRSREEEGESSPSIEFWEEKTDFLLTENNNNDDMITNNNIIKSDNTNNTSNNNSNYNSDHIDSSSISKSINSTTNDSSNVTSNSSSKSNDNNCSNINNNSRKSDSNNITNNGSHIKSKFITRRSLVCDPSRPSISIREHILNLRNKEHLMENRNVDRCYITTPEGSPPRENPTGERTQNRIQALASTRVYLDPNVFERSADDEFSTNIIRKDQDTNQIVESQGVHIGPRVFERSIVDASLLSDYVYSNIIRQNHDASQSAASTNVTRKRKVTAERAESPKVHVGPKVFERSAVNASLPGNDVYTNVIRKNHDATLLAASSRENLGPKVFERSAVNASLPGDDVYTNVIRKSVVEEVLAKDPNRDDTMERRSTQRRGEHLMVPKSCKAEVRKEVVVPRCELTTEI